MVLLRLVRANLATHKVRTGLTVAAMALAVSLVVAVTSGYAMVEATLQRYFDRVIGSADARLVRRGDPTGPFPQAVLDELRSDPQVKQIIARLDTRLGLLTADGKPVPGHTTHVIGVARPEDTDVDSLHIDAGEWFEGSDGNGVVVDQAMIEEMRLRVGGEFQIAAGTQPLKLRVVGVVHMPDIVAHEEKTLYVPLHTLQRHLALVGQVSRASVQLRPGADPKAFAERWSARLAGLDVPLELKLARDSRQRVGQILEAFRMVSYLGGMVSLLAATFIIFSTLSMGVSERSRVLGMLRSVGATRWQLARLVVMEGVALAVPAAVLGVGLGWVWVQLLAWRGHEVLMAGAIISVGGVVVGAAGSMLAALLASLLPAVAAMRVSPLAALAPLAAPSAGRMPWRAVIIGAILVCIDPLLLYSGAPRPVKFVGHFVLGLPAMMLGFFLLAPLFVWLVDRLGAGMVAWVLRLRPELLRQQLSGGIWRSAGTGAALMVGLACLVVMQTHGRSMLFSWRLPDKFPDYFIASTLGFDEKGLEELANMPGIARERIDGTERPALLPIAIGVATPERSEPAGPFESIFAADTTLFLGVDPDRALRMLELDFREGNMADAMAGLKQGHHIIVTDEFRQLHNLHLGGQLRLRTSHGTIEAWTVCGVVFSPGIDVMVNLFGIERMFEERSAASVFGTMEEAKRDFGVGRIHLVAANLDPGTDRHALEAKLGLALRLAGVRGGDVRTIKAMIQRGFLGLLNLLSTVAFAAMLVASLGVANTIVASIRSRRWTLGILRSVGLTRGQLARLLLGEVLMLGLVGCALGLAAGAELTSSAAAMTRFIIGYIAPLLVPWEIIAGGVASVMALAVLAGLWPALSAARAQPLDLLQSGRSAG